MIKGHLILYLLSICSFCGSKEKLAFKERGSIDRLLEVCIILTDLPGASFMTLMVNFTFTAAEGSRGTASTPWGSRTITSLCPGSLLASANRNGN